MITTLFLNLIYAIIYVLTTPIRALPDVALDGGFGVAITTASGYLSSFDSFIPVTTILTLLALYISIEVAYLTYKLIMWLVKRFPTQS